MPPYLVNHASGQQEGPLDWNQLKQGVQSRRIAGSAVVTDIPTGQQRPVSDIPDLAAPAAPSGGGGAALIPADNPPALIGYYLGIFSLLSCVPLLGLAGVVMAVAAVVLGVRGLRNIRENPQKHGTVHAWIGIIGGSLCGLVGLVIQVAIVVALIAEAR